MQPQPLPASFPLNAPSAPHALSPQVPFVPSRLYSPGSPTWRAAVACYADCLAPRDWPLAWSVVPMIHIDDKRAGQLPPTSAWSALRLRSPPPFDSIVQHLKQVGGALQLCVPDWRAQHVPTAVLLWLGCLWFMTLGHIAWKALHPMDSRLS